MNRRTRVMVAGAIVAAVSLVINHVSAMDLDLPQAPTGHTATAPTGPAAQALAQLGTTATDAEPDYERTDFGQPWSDAAEGVSGSFNGCDTASDIMRRDFDDLVIDPNSQGCSPATGLLIVPYTGQRETYIRHGESSIDIDHVVSLDDGCISGLCGEGVDADTRERFANDPLNLLATAESANRSKGPRAVAAWPGDTEIGRSVTEAGLCVLVVRQIAVKTSYELTVTAAERKAMTSVLSGCSDTTMPTSAETDVPAPSR